MKPILEVAYLTDDHGNTLEKCPGCKICDRIAELMKQIVVDPVEKYKYLLDKGEDLSTSEIIYLYEKGVEKKQIIKATKLTWEELNQLLADCEFVDKKSLKAVEKMAGKPNKFNMTKEQAEQLAAEGKNKSEIAKIAGVSLPTYLHHAKKWEGKVEKKAQPKTNNEEITSLIEKLKEQLKQKDGTIERLREKIDQLEQDKLDIHAAANDTESELMTDSEIWKQQALQYKAENKRLNDNLTETNQELAKYKGENVLFKATLKAVL